jgi:hypothetical protein
MENLLAFFFTWGIIGYVVYCFVFPPKDSCEISDRFELGYMENNNQNTTTGKQEEDELKVLKREIEIAKLRKELVKLKARQVHAPNSKNKPKDQVDVNPIIKDCIDALVSMGEKKSVARATVNKYFASNPNTKTVEEFITGVFK